MQDIAFAIAKFLEATFTILPALGWLPNILFTIVGVLGMVYWLGLQGKYNRKAKEQGTIA